MNILFICSRNQWRSPTAEQVFRRHPNLAVRSAGTSRNAKKKVSADLLQWADVICVMEEKHKNRLVAEYGRIIAFKPLHILDIPDDYLFMDPRLIAILKETVPAMLKLTVQGTDSH
ncbi:low molecular weight protein tyrosine phosphatase family protein [Erwinia persicina]|uniref:Phosphotyrosine protein phosphatase n=1 Tax=Erwinia persicina TaxID=55211 RepID=A0A3S5GSN6_9GAMM|nr:phosphotyrosine protein phosphatase [Erwinia persicina]AXU94164.1 phosphotyrosine protein phosphatase [Erwinia persicina]MBD8108857.1 phosphotyrosine protein phosphatase [Erwinia persicina]MBD8211956.1 phosphotyrosine protein phosphatase [Erwinia persicina]QZQ51356.1 phosphotyrosine protein phosphatase [Erwinia persicina]TKJ85096.1 phosphotyrosine protein phosphatase [Erwinia persicina]